MWSCLPILRYFCAWMKRHSDRVEPIFYSSRVTPYPENIDKSPMGEQVHGEAPFVLVILG